MFSNFIGCSAMFTFFVNVAPCYSQQLEIIFAYAYICLKCKSYRHFIIQKHSLDKKTLMSSDDLAFKYCKW